MNVSVSVEAAAETVRNGGVIVAPTETFYALVGSVFDAAVVERIFQMKERQGGKALPVIAADTATVSSNFSVSEASRRAMDAFWPGPLTLVLEPLNESLRHLQADDGTVAVRVSPNALISEVALGAGGLVTSTSANLSGGPAVTSLAELSPQVKERVDAMLDGGVTPGGVASTIARWQKDHWTIYREGPVSLSELDALMKVTR